MQSNNKMFFVDYDEIAEFGWSQRSTKILLCQNYRFVRDGKYVDTTNWRCSLYSKYKCKARAITRTVDENLVVKLTNPSHNHSPPRL